ncbi:MAG TPA: glycoside hydrolase family 3 N-terminal domain-containing protein [Candidatus Limnocylindrales bacterium]|nr:glycoside hydrolase family 3 N-terminal domain-containing protein [Candidatus Limnocylindrales bacterium]
MVQSTGGTRLTRRRLLAGVGSTEQAAELALGAGMDLLVYDPDIVTEVVDSVVALVRTGKIKESQIDEAVARVDTLRH